MNKTLSRWMIAWFTVLSFSAFASDEAAPQKVFRVCGEVQSRQIFMIKTEGWPQMHTGVELIAESLEEPVFAMSQESVMTQALESLEIGSSVCLIGTVSRSGDGKLVMKVRSVE